MDKTSGQAQEVLSENLKDMLRYKDTPEEFYQVVSAYQLGRIADSLDQLCSILRSGIYTYPS